MATFARLARLIQPIYTRLPIHNLYRIYTMALTDGAVINTTTLTRFMVRAVSKDGKPRDKYFPEMPQADKEFEATLSTNDHRRIELAIVTIIKSSSR